MAKQLFKIQRNKTGISFNRVKKATAMKAGKTGKRRKSGKGKRGRRRKSRKS